MIYDYTILPTLNTDFYTLLDEFSMSIDTADPGNIGSY